MKRTINFNYLEITKKLSKVLEINNNQFLSQRLNAIWYENCTSKIVSVPIFLWLHFNFDRISNKTQNFYYNRQFFRNVTLKHYFKQFLFRKLF